MRIACLGGGPAGLYFAISMKLRDPAHEIVVIERNRPDDTFGWGVVLSDDTLDNLAANDAKSAEAILHFTINDFAWRPCATRAAAAYATEAPYFNRMGIDTVVLGPGDIDQAHQPDEYLDEARIEPMLELLRELIRRFCMGSP